MNLNGSVKANLQFINYIKAKYLLLNSENWMYKNSTKINFLLPMKENVDGYGKNSTGKL